MIDDISPPYTQKAEYFNRIWRRDRILNNPEAFKDIIRKWYTKNPFIVNKGGVKNYLLILLI